MAVIVPFESHSTASIDQLVALVAADMERVNSTILSRTGSEVTMIPEVANHLISSGGKRLRPMLTLAMANLTGYAGDGHIKLAAAVEFMHTATLLHDDVVDQSELRRGKLSARMLWGNEASVLVGDFLLGQAFRMMVEVGSLRALDILSSAAATIAEGEVMQLAAAKNTATTEDEYLAVIRGKTAELFAAACEVGPVIANRPKAEQTACRSVGMNLGIAFQLVDDVLDYGGKAAKLGKNVGDDFREGKITLPVNSPELVDWLASEMLTYNVKPEIEAFDLSMIWQAVLMQKQGKIKGPLHVQFVMGVKNAMPVDRETFNFYIDTLKRIAPDATWTGAGIGKGQLMLNRWSLEAGGHCRTGLEDNIRWDETGKLAPSNAALVKRVADLCAEYGRRPATTVEARKILGLAAA